MPWHLEVLARRQRRVLEEIGPILSRRGFYLGGGTAVALHLGHRRSVDFDWFTPSGLDDPSAFAKELDVDGVNLLNTEVAPGTLHGTVRGVQVRLLRYRYPFLAPLRKGLTGIRIAAKADLAAMKLLAVAQRGDKKDFVDIYALGSESDSLAQMLRWYQKKFARADFAHLLYSLSYFQDADSQRLPRMLWRARWPEIKETMTRWLAAMK